MLPARLAAYGEDGRYLVALGSRAVRGAARVRVDLRAEVFSSDAPNGMPIRVLDLSSSGARLRGAALRVGDDFELRLVPPGRRDVARVRCVVVRTVPESVPPEVGVTFCGGPLSFRLQLTASLSS
jgi:hypothetical protein